MRESLGGAAWPTWKLLYHNAGDNLDGWLYNGSTSPAITTVMSVTGDGITSGAAHVGGGGSGGALLPVLCSPLLTVISADMMLTEDGLNKSSWIEIAVGAGQLYDFDRWRARLGCGALVGMGNSELAVDTIPIANTINEWINVKLELFGIAATLSVNGVRIGRGFSAARGEQETVWVSTRPHSGASATDSPKIKNIFVWGADVGPAR